MTRHPALPLGRSHCKHCGREMTPEQRQLLLTYHSTECASEATIAVLDKIQRDAEHALTTLRGDRRALNSLGAA